MVELSTIETAPERSALIPRISFEWHAPSLSVVVVLRHEIPADDVAMGRHPDDQGEPGEGPVRVDPLEVKEMISVQGLKLDSREGASELQALIDAGTRRMERIDRWARGQETEQDRWTLQNADGFESAATCSCAMTESSMHRCPVHGEDAPPS